MRNILILEDINAHAKALKNLIQGSFNDVNILEYVLILLLIFLTILSGYSFGCIGFNSLFSISIK